MFRDGMLKKQLKRLGTIFFHDFPLLTMDAKEKIILDAMKKEGKPMRPGDIAIKAEMDKAEVSKIIDNLKKEGKVISPKRCFYEPV